VGEKKKKIAIFSRGTFATLENGNYYFILFFSFSLKETRKKWQFFFLFLLP
jgi:hypothetical protein